MKYKRNLELEGRAVGHVLACRDLLCFEGTRQPGLNAVVKRHVEQLKYPMSKQRKQMQL